MLKKEEKWCLEGSSKHEMSNVKSPTSSVNSPIEKCPKVKSHKIKYPNVKCPNVNV